MAIKQQTLFKSEKIFLRDSYEATSPNRLSSYLPRLILIFVVNQTKIPRKIRSTLELGSRGCERRQAGSFAANLRESLCFLVHPPLLQPRAETLQKGWKSRSEGFVARSHPPDAFTAVYQPVHHRLPISIVTGGRFYHAAKKQ